MASSIFYSPDPLPSHQPPPSTADAGTAIDNNDNDEPIYGPETSPPATRSPSVTASFVTAQSVADDDDGYHNDGFGSDDSDLLTRRTPSPVLFGDNHTHYGAISQYIAVMESVTWEQDLDAARAAKMVWDVRQAVKRGDLRGETDAEWLKRWRAERGEVEEGEEDGEANGDGEEGGEGTEAGRGTDENQKPLSKDMQDLVRGYFGAWPLTRKRAPREWDIPRPAPEPERKKRKLNTEKGSNRKDKTRLVKDWHKPPRPQFYYPPGKRDGGEEAKGDDGDGTSSSHDEVAESGEEEEEEEEEAEHSHSEVEQDKDASTNTASDINVADSSLPFPNLPLLQPLNSALLAYHLRAAKPFLKNQPTDDEATAAALAGVIGSQTSCAVRLLEQLFAVRKRMVWGRQDMTGRKPTFVRRKRKPPPKKRKTQNHDGDQEEEEDQDEYDDEDEDEDEDDDDDDDDDELEYGNENGNSTGPSSTAGGGVIDYYSYVHLRRNRLNPLSWNDILAAASALSSSSTPVAAQRPRFSAAAIERAEARCRKLFLPTSAQKKRDEMLAELRDALREPVMWGDEKRYKYKEKPISDKRLIELGKRLEKKRRKMLASEEEKKKRGQDNGNELEDDKGEKEERARKRQSKDKRKQGHDVEDGEDDENTSNEDTEDEEDEEEGDVPPEYESWYGFSSDDDVGGALNKTDIPSSIPPMMVPGNRRRRSKRPQYPSSISSSSSRSSTPEEYVSAQEEEEEPQDG